jgi:hypothetical protein
MPARLLQLPAKQILLAGPALWVHNHSCAAFTFSWVYSSVNILNDYRIKNDLCYRPRLRKGRFDLQKHPRSWQR